MIAIKSMDDPATAGASADRRTWLPVCSCALSPWHGTRALHFGERCSSLISLTRASFQSRMTLCGEIFRTSADKEIGPNPLLPKR
jgi:hypothetical protein